MANYGFQCFDEKTGALILDISDRLTKVMGIINPEGASDFSGAVTLTAEQLRGGNVFAFPLGAIVYNIDAERLKNTSTFKSTVSIVNDTISCTAINYPVMYGVW